MSVNILAIVGSLRAGSVNAATARAALTVTPEDASMSLYDVSDIPLYNGDVEAAGLPDSVVALQNAVGAADGLLFFSPEYNGSFPAVTKNVIDWLTRPPKLWEGTSVSMVVTTPGPRAGDSFRGHFSTIMGFQPIRLFEPIGIGEYRDKLNEAGQLTAHETLAELGDFLGRFVGFCRAS